MSVIHNDLLLTAEEGGYNLTRSLRFRSSASAYLNRTPASAGNRKTWTYSTWVKRGALGSTQSFFSAGTTSTTACSFQFNSADRIQYFVSYSGGSAYGYTTAVYRDPSAWYHIVLSFDSTQATESNRFKIYVNGVQLSYTTEGTVIAQNGDYGVNSTSVHNLSRYSNNSSDYFDGYLTEINFIDGQALTPSSFGETSSTTGVWQPKKYSGTYGTNGFYLPFTDNSALTSGSNAGLGKDFSGNGNYWNTNNISITSGVTYDSMTDVPTLTSATTANFNVLNATIRPYSTTGNILNANLRVTNTGGTNVSGSAWGTIAVTSGKWYAECTVTTVGNWSGSSDYIGVSNNAVTAGLGTYNGPLRDAGYTYVSNGQKSVNGTNSSYGATYTTGDVIGIALDADAGTIEFYKNGTSQGVAFTSMTNTGGYLFGSTLSNNGVHDFNFGQRPFAYTPPTGYVALNTFNLPTPTIGATASSQANKYFDINLWSGTGSARSITNSGFKPAFVWAKSRSAGYDHVLDDSVRGAGLTLISNSTGAEVNEGTSGLTSFDTNGFSIGGASGGWNSNTGATYVGWQWRGSDSSAVTNTAGSITSTVSANTTSGFSVVTYTGNASVASFGHGLGVAPKFIIIKNRSTSGAGSNWCVGINISGWNWATDYLYLNTSGAKATDGGTTQFYSAPTSTVVNIGGGTNTNGNGNSMVAYCFAEVAGFSKFGSYTGNGSADGSFIYTGFKPKFVLIKRTDSGNNWFILDGSRNTYNLTNAQLLPNSSSAESTGTDCNIDMLSNGFKLRTALDASNGSGGTYIYMAFAENPLKYSLAR